MNKKIIYMTVSVIIIIAVGALFIVSARNGSGRYEKIHKAGESCGNANFVVDGGPMMPPPPAGVHFGRGPNFGEVKFSHEQKLKLKKLDERLDEDMKSLHATENELREQYREKIDSVLTDEQYRKIENMRYDLRREMRKLNDKRDSLIKKHHKDFESILTAEQKAILESNEKESNKNIKPEK